MCVGEFEMDYLEEAYSEQAKMESESLIIKSYLEYIFGKDTWEEDLALGKLPVYYVK